MDYSQYQRDHYWKVVMQREAVNMSHLALREKLESEGYTVLDIENVGEFTNIHTARIDDFKKATFQDRDGNEYVTYVAANGKRYDEKSFSPNWMPTTI